jgi:signal transduction histidine kinase
MSQTSHADHDRPDGADGDTMFLAGGETGALLRAIDWTATALGPVRDWPQSLRTSLSICLGSPFPAALYWGPELVMFYNDALLPVVGAAHPGALGRPASAVWSELREIIEPWLRRVLGTGRAISSDDLMLPRLRHGRPEHAYFTLNCSPIRDETGRIGGVFCAVVDTTDKIIRASVLAEEQVARAAAEAARAQIYSLFMQAPAPICIFEGPEHRYTFANQPYLALIGRDDVIGVRFADAYPERKLTLARLDHAYATGETFRSDDVRFRYARRHPDELEDSVLNVVYQPYRDHEGKVCGISVVAFDVTDVVLAQHVSEQARRHAEASAEAHRAVLEFQERFVAVLGHDLRNPLAAIDMAAGLLRQHAEQANDSLAIRILARVRSSSLRMSRMVEQILDLSRSRIGGGLGVRPAPMDLCAMLTGIVEELRTANPSHKLELRCAAIVGVWDRDRLEQVFSNLIGNAIHHGSPKTPITVEAREVGAEVHVEVHNEGPVIPESLRKMLFNPFRRGDRDSRAVRTAGLGLGLYISREVVVAHGGEIDVRSSAAEGTTFLVTLPRSAAPRSPQE